MANENSRDPTNPKPQSIPLAKIHDLPGIPLVRQPDKSYGGLVTSIQSGGGTKQVLSYTLSPSLEVDFVLDAVDILMREHGVSLHAETVIHSDQGCHYTSCKFIELVEHNELRRSMSRKGNCWDNAPQESFFGHMKDLIDLTGDPSFDEVKAIIDDYMSYYNNERYQWDLAKLSPNEFLLYHYRRLSS